MPKYRRKRTVAMRRNSEENEHSFCSASNRTLDFLDQIKRKRYPIKSQGRN